MENKGYIEQEIEDEISSSIEKEENPRTVHDRMRIGAAFEEENNKIRFLLVFLTVFFTRTVKPGRPPLCGLSAVIFCDTLRISIGLIIPMKEALRNCCQ